MCIRDRHKHTIRRRETKHCATRVVGDADDVYLSTAVLEKLLDGAAEVAARPGAAEPPAKLGKGPDQNGSVEGAAKCTSDKGGRGLGRRIDGLIHRRRFGNGYATVIGI